ncbi:MAG: hypothetical protein MZV70_71340 [Desulfobacterales bacterium]|nr:hypothetical protein [Desulfobacterales bacterium]
MGLIITNCIVMGRAEAYAMNNPPLRSFVDGLGQRPGLRLGAGRRSRFCASCWDPARLFGYAVVPEVIIAGRLRRQRAAAAGALGAVHHDRAVRVAGARSLLEKN